jgi:hypothetical protein
MADKDVLAIDFGTANTYYCKCPSDQISPVGIDFGDGRDGLSTAILYRGSKSPLVGNVALEEYGEATADDRKDYVLRTQFKPDIVNSTEAQQAAIDFLTAVREEGKSQHMDLEPTHREVIIGVPSEAGDAFRQALSRIAKDAGYGEIRTVDEPKGALLYHVSHKDIPTKDALRGILVVDFGGGTCDFAFMYRGNVRHSWGDLDLGGRLFDDLFFQWFLDDNPDVLDGLRKEGNEYFVHSYLCREMKEFFSRTMARDRSESVTKAVRHYGKIKDMTWQAFIDRAQSYKPSSTLKRYLADVGLASSKLLESDTPLDLLAWFKECLANGIRDNKIEKSDMHFIILAGGSSQWPFVAEIVCEELNLDETNVMRSDRPYVAISEGLAILPALQAKFKKTQDTLRQEFPTFAKNTLMPFIAKRCKGLSSQIADAMTMELFDKKIGPILLDFKKTGGSVASLKKKISAAASSFEPQIEKITEEKMSILMRGLPVALDELASKWFEKYGLTWGTSDISISDYDVGKAGATDVEIPEFYEDIENAITIVSVSLITSISAMICGGGGMALIVSGPIGLIIGVILGIVIGALAAVYGIEKAKGMAENWEGTPKFLIRRALSTSKIDKVRTDMKSQIEDKIENGLSELHVEFERQAAERVEREIDALSEINQI